MLHFGHRFECAALGMLDLTRVCHASLRSSGAGGVSHRMCLASDSGRNCVACVSCPQSLAATRPLVCASEVHTRQKLSRVCMGPAAAGSTRYRAKRFDVVVTQLDESAADPLAEPGEDASLAQKQDELGEDQGAGCAAAPTRLAEPARTWQRPTQKKNKTRRKRLEMWWQRGWPRKTSRRCPEQVMQACAHARPLSLAPSLSHSRNAYMKLYTCVYTAHTHARTRKHTHTHTHTHIPV